MTEPLTKVDSAVDGVAPTDAKEHKKPRQSTVAAPGVFKLEDLSMFSSVHCESFGFAFRSGLTLSVQWQRAASSKSHLKPSRLVGKPASFKFPPLSECRLTSLSLSRKVNTSPATVEDKEILAKHLTSPPIKKIDLHFPLGLEVTARNLKGVTIKDALDAIHKKFKKSVSPHLSGPLSAQQC